jgi:dihydroorotase
VAKLRIKGGRVIDAAQGLDFFGDVFIRDGVVESVVAAGDLNRPADLSDCETFEAEGCIVSPGFVDLHCHLREPGYEDKETIATGTQAAARGGFTTVCCMANTKPPIDSRAIVEYVQKTARAVGAVRVHPLACVTKGMAGQELTEMGDLIDAGAVAFSDDGKAVATSALMRNALEYARMFDRPIVEHAEDSALSAGGVMNEGAVATRLGLKGWPSAAEDVIIARDLQLAELTGGRLHVAHLSTARGVELVAEAKARGARVTAEVTPHHLALTEEWVAGIHWDGRRVPPYDTNTKVNPPLRTEADRQALLKGLKDGTIDAIATDHAPHTVVDKLCEYDFAAFGISGLETALATLLRLVRLGELDLKLMLEKLTSGPAKTFGLVAGTLRPGAPGDVTVIGPNLRWVVDPAEFASRGQNTPLAGTPMVGRVIATIVGGEVVFNARG